MRNMNDKSKALFIYIVLNTECVFGLELLKNFAGCLICCCHARLLQKRSMMGLIEIKELFSLKHFYVKIARR